MNKYTISCTEEQTRKALELGAPLDTWGFAREPVIPTSEQMLGWLEEQKGINNIVIAKPTRWLFIIYDEICYHSTGEGYNSRKEATLAAIDAALEYLTNNKK